ncbi:MAG TPA: glycosyltransferase family 4 protein [Candidatus Dormibacteraeota bacterium]|nr:glycosyltransferase family 4 protein [Candidatus Dormibacteraeota bacterium]
MTSKAEGRPRLCFVGPLAGSRHGYVVTQGVWLSRHFRDAGYDVTAVSASPNRYARLLDITWTLLRRRRRIDILFLHVYGGASFVVEDVASLIALRSRHRIVMMLHGGAMPEFMASFPRWTRRVLRRADAIVAPSPFLARALEPYGLRCGVIPNVLNIRLYPFRLRSVLGPRLFWMRSFHPVYNPLMAVDVLERLRTTHPDATLVMGGQDKGMQADVERHARDRGLGDAVRLPGFLDMERKLREGSASDIFINTSHVDNMPVAVLEAGALGLPVVSTTVGGIADLLKDGETALLTPDGDVEAMVEAIRRLLRDPDLAGRLSAAGRRLAERSSWDQVRSQWESLFASLLIDADARGSGGGHGPHGTPGPAPR